MSSKKNNKTVVILDWDDTLFPTSAFHNKLFKNDFDGNSLQMLSQRVLAIIKRCCLLYGSLNTFIVTNGSKGWVQESLKTIMKYCRDNNIQNSFGEISKLITRNFICILSANHLYSKQFPKQTILWKYYTFYTIANFKNADIMISIGDSYDEYVASQHVKKTNDSIKSLHRLRLTEQPKISEMNEQFKLILKLLDILPQHNEEFDVDINQLKLEAS